MSDYLFEYSGTNMSLKNADDLWTLKELAQDRKEWTNSVTFIFPQKQQRTQWQTIKLHLWYLIRKFLTISDYLKFDINIIFFQPQFLHFLYQTFVFYKTEQLSNGFRIKLFFQKTSVQYKPKCKPNCTLSLIPLYFCTILNNILENIRCISSRLLFSICNKESCEIPSQH